MSRHDFMVSTPTEFEAISKAARQAQEADAREAWERARAVAAISVMPYSKKPLSPAEVMPLPWDRKGGKKKKKATMTVAEREKEAAEFAKKHGITTI